MFSRLFRVLIMLILIVSSISLASAATLPKDWQTKWQDDWSKYSYAQQVQIYSYLNPSDRTKVESLQGNSGFTTKWNKYQSGDWSDIERSSDLNALIEAGVFDGSPEALTKIEEYFKDESRDNRAEVAEAFMRYNLGDFAKLMSQSDDLSLVESSLNSVDQCDPGVFNLFCVFNSELDLEEEFMDEVDRTTRSVIWRAQNGRLAEAYERAIAQDPDLSFAEFVNNQISKETLSVAFDIMGSSQDCGTQSLSECRNQVEELISNCAEDQESQCKLAGRISSNAFQNEAIQTGLLYEAVAGILNPDPQGVNAAKLFGFEADYSQLPSFIRDDFGSQMCVAKIEGYLDKEISNGGGVTKYTVLNTSKEIAVVADLRGQRTPITPDGKTAITYSFFLRAQDEPLDYILAVSYVQDGQKKNVAITEVKQLSAGGTVSDFENINLPLGEDFETVDESSFIIGLLATEQGTTRTHVHLTYPLVLVTSGDYFFDGGSGGPDNSVGNGVAQSTEGSSILTESDMTSMLFG